MAVTVLGLVPMAVTTSPAQAATTCTGDVCVVDNSVATPLGPVTVTVSSANVVSVTLTPITRTVIFGIPITFPPGPPSRPGHTRTTIETAGGIINTRMKAPTRRYVAPSRIGVDNARRSGPR
jgi:hypothetical protein